MNAFELPADADARAEYILESAFCIFVRHFNPVWLRLVYFAGAKWLAVQENEATLPVASRISGVVPLWRRNM